MYELKMHMNDIAIHSMEITSRTDDNTSLFPQRAIPLSSADGAKNSQDAAAHTDGSEHTRDTPTHVVNTSQCLCCLQATVKRMDQDQKPPARELKCAHASCFQTGGHFISDGFTVVSCSYRKSLKCNGALGRAQFGHDGLCCINS